MRVISWLVVADGILAGVLMIAVIGGTYEAHWIPRAAVLLILGGMGPIAAALIATRNPRIAARIDLCLIPISALLAIRLESQLFPEKSLFLPIFAVLIAPGFFWLLAARRRWPLLLSAWPFAGRPGVRLLAGCSFGLMLIAISLLGSLFIPWYPFGDCGGLPLLDGEGHPRDTDFTAKILFVGPETWHGYSLWALVHVEKRFSAGLGSDLVILRNYFKTGDQSQQYFVEGFRSGAFAWVLPIITREECGHTARLDRAGVEIRILQGGRPKSGARLIGVVEDCKYAYPRPGVSVRVDGPASSVVLVTDSVGIYDANELPPGAYTLTLPDGTTSSIQLSEGKIERQDLCVK